MGTGGGCARRAARAAGGMSGVKTQGLRELPAVGNGDLLARLAVFGAAALHGLHHVHPLLDAAEDDVLAVQPAQKCGSHQWGAATSPGSPQRDAVPPPPHTHHSVLAVQMKNWEPFVLGPALAMDRMPGPVCFRMKFSSANFSP